MGIGGRKFIGIGLAALAALSGCVSEIPVSAPPYTAPSISAPPTRPTAGAPSQASVELARYYGRIQNDFLARGLMRTDGGGPDTAFTDTDLIRNFVRIALFDEYTRGRNGQLQARRSETTLRRWETPVRMQVEFGANVPAPIRQLESANINNYAARLGRITGHPVSTVSSGGNFHVLILNEDDRRGYGARIRQIVPNIDANSLRTLTDMPRTQLCIVIAFSDGVDQGFSTAIAVIRSEHPDLLRLSCVHEELAQGMGLGNDSPRARPSIFNDDEEFGLLTTHDELLLKMLYDRRLRVGMTALTATPIVEIIAAEYMAGPV